jgi:hypothetical protein
LEVSLRDVDDDQTGGYKMRMNDLTLKSKDPFRARLLLSTLAAGKSTTCFDASNFFSTTHNLGGAATPATTVTGGGNYLSFTAASADGVNHAFAILIHGPDQGVVRPLMFQARKEPKFMTDAGTPQSFKAKKAGYWIDLEAAAAFGYWWDAVLLEITNTPTLIELSECLDAARQQFRGFTLPTALPTDPLEYVHEQMQFRPDVSTVVCSTGLEMLFTHLLGEERIGVSVAGSTSGFTNNIYYNKFGLVTSNYMNVA